MKCGYDNGNRGNGEPGCFPQTTSSLAAPANGNGRNSTAFTNENTALLAPTASATVRIAAPAIAGDRRNWRAANCSSEIKPIGVPPDGQGSTGARAATVPLSFSR